MEAQVYEKPAPRESKSPSHVARVQVQNRRRGYLERNPLYYDSLEHEFADPILYERLVKRFQTPKEREEEGKAKGYGRTLEADLLRGEAKLSHLKDSETNGNGLAEGVGESDETGLEQEWERSALYKEQGTERWRAFLQERFVRGKDEDFDYSQVDDNEELDVISKREAEDAWFDQEEPDWIVDNETAGQKTGETGIQDF